jgi:hypothetical protein
MVSIDRARLTVLMILCGTVAVLAPSAGHAQVTFYPSLAATSTYSNNVNFVDDQGEDLSDVVTRISLALPVRGNNWSLLYRPSIQRYRDFSELDHTNHLLRFDWGHQLSRASSTTLSSFYQRSQASGDPNFLGVGTPTPTDDTPGGTGAPNPNDNTPLGLALSPRAAQETAAVAWGISGQASTRWTVNGALTGSVTRTEPIPGVETGGALVSENKNAYSLSVGASRSISAHQSIGVSYFYRTVSGDITAEDLHQVGMNGRYQLGRLSGLSYGAGAFTRGDRIDFHGRFGYNWDARVVRLAILLDRQSSIGGNLAGTSNINNFSFLMGSSVEDKLVWAVSTRYQLREAVAENDIFGDIRTWAQTAGIEYRPHRNIGIRLDGTHSRQRGSDLEGLNGEFVTASVGFVWYILGYGQGEGR